MFEYQEHYTGKYVFLGHWNEIHLNVDFFIVLRWNLDIGNEYLLFANSKHRHVENV